MAQEYIGFVFYGANVVLMPNSAIGGDLGIFNLPHFRMLALEEQFYMMWPWFVGSRLSRRVLIRICAVGISAAIICRVGIFLIRYSIPVEYYRLPTRMDSLLMGAAIASIPLPGKALARWVLGLTVPIYAELVWAAGNSLFTSTPIVLAGYTALAVLYASLLVLALHLGTFTARVMNLRPLRFLGKLSYGLYLWHYLFLAQADRFTARIQGALHPRFAASVVSFAILFGLSILIAMGSYPLIELPFLRLKDRFEPKVPRSEATLPGSEARLEGAHS